MFPLFPRHFGIVKFFEFLHVYFIINIILLCLLSLCTIWYNRKNNSYTSLVVRRKVSRDNVTSVPTVDRCINVVIILLLGFLSCFILKFQHNLNKQLSILYINIYIYTCICIYIHIYIFICKNKKVPRSIVVIITFLLFFSSFLWIRHIDWVIIFFLLVDMWKKRKKFR